MLDSVVPVGGHQVLGFLVGVEGALESAVSLCRPEPFKTERSDHLSLGHCPSPVSTGSASSHGLCSWLLEVT